MKSNISFHGAALEYIKNNLVKHLAFIVFYLEQDGVINAKDNTSGLFELAKNYFQNRYEHLYATQNRYQDMYFLHINFDNIKFPMAKLIHDEFNKLRT
jgi:hypothetical protein